MNGYWTIHEVEELNLRHKITATWLENRWVVIEFDNGIKVKIKNY